VLLPFATGTDVPKPYGITVGEIKVYDEKSLEDLLNNAYNNLKAINAFDPGVTKQLGTMQGATSNQTGVSVTGGTAAPPAQSGPPALTLPTSSAVSAGNFLNEETQLGLQIINTQLLLHGALNDQAAGDKRRVTVGLPISIAVPPGSKYQEAVADVQISVCGWKDKAVSLALLLPQEKTYNVASLVSKTGSVGGGGTIAGVVNLGGSFLRGHQSYFLVQDQDTLAMQRPDDATGCDEGTHAVTFAWQFRPVLGQKVVRDGMRQTFAQLSVPNDPGNGPAALKAIVLTSWRRYDARTGRVGGRIDPPDRIGTPDKPPKAIPLFSRPIPSYVEVYDNGDGNLTVLAQGSYWPGTRIRIGGTVQDASSSNFEQNDSDIRFVASALSLAVTGASTVNGDGTEWPVVPPRLLPPFLSSVPRLGSGSADVRPLTLSNKSGNADQTLTTEFRGIKDELKSLPDVDCKDQNGASCPGLDTKQVELAGLGHVVRLTFHIPAAAPQGTWIFTLTSNGKIVGNASFLVDPVTVHPFKDTSSLVRVRLAGLLPYDATNPDVIVIGNKVFGLRDTPYYERTPDHATALVPNDLIATYRSLTWQRFLDPAPVRVEYAEHVLYPIPFFPASAAGASEFSISSITPITATKPVDPVHKDQIQATLMVPPATPQKASNRYAISGVRLSSLRFVEPAIEPDFVSDTLVTFGLTDDQVKQYKNLVLQYGAGQRLIQALSPAAPPTPPARSLTAQPAAGIPVTTQTPLTISGTGMSQVVAIRYNDQALPFNPVSDTKLNLTLIAPQTGKTVLAAPGIVVVFEYLDKSLVPYSIPVAAASK
jgi:hypothetical protein